MVWCVASGNSSLSRYEMLSTQAGAAYSPAANSHWWCHGSCPSCQTLKVTFPICFSGCKQVFSNTWSLNPMKQLQMCPGLGAKIGSVTSAQLPQALEVVFDMYWSWWPRLLLKYCEFRNSWCRETRCALKGPEMFCICYVYVRILLWLMTEFRTRSNVQTQVEAILLIYNKYNSITV